MTGDNHGWCAKLFYRWKSHRGV